MGKELPKQLEADEMTPAPTSGVQAKEDKDLFDEVADELGFPEAEGDTETQMLSADVLAKIAGTMTTTLQAPATEIPEPKESGEVDHEITPPAGTVIAA